MQINDEQLKKFILEAGLVSRSDIEEAVVVAEAKNQRFGNILLSEGKISETDLKKMEAFVLGIPFVDLTKLKIPNYDLLELEKYDHIYVMLSRGSNSRTNCSQP